MVITNIAPPRGEAVHAADYLKQYVDESPAFIEAALALLSSVSDGNKPLAVCLKSLGADPAGVRSWCDGLADLAQCLDIISKDYHLRAGSSYGGQQDVYHLHTKRPIAAAAAEKDHLTAIRDLHAFFTEAHHRLEGHPDDQSMAAAAIRQLEVMEASFLQFPDKEHLKLLAGYLWEPRRFVGGEAGCEAELISVLQQTVDQLQPLQDRLEEAGGALGDIISRSEDILLGTIPSCLRALTAVIHDIRASSERRSLEGCPNFQVSHVGYYENRGQRDRYQSVHFWYDEVDQCLGMLQDFSSEFHRSVNGNAASPDVQRVAGEIGQAATGLLNLFQQGALLHLAQTVPQPKSY
ncbi:MAG: hypothetical protein J0L97_00205 [Alphaproteobacteria bacterium]|nr:hypothetical protein [Alphaproteobacteria bacterium]